MNYDKYRTETIEPDHTFLGGMGVSETTVASVKKVAKKAAGVAASSTSTALEVSKVVTPVAGHLASAGAHVALMARDGVSVSKTEAHIAVLKEISADLTKTPDLCSCDHCPEVVGYAISQKNKKLDRKLTQIGVHATTRVEPVENTHQLKRPAFARRTLPTRTLGKEAHILGNLADNAGAFRHDDHRACPQTRLALPHRIEVQRHIEIAPR